MRNLFVAFFVMLAFSGYAYGEFFIEPVNVRVKNSDLTVIGTLQSVTEYKTREINYYIGELVIEKALFGNVKTPDGFALKSGSKIKIEWRNSNNVGCRLGFPENQKGIWFLKIDEGTIQPLASGSMAPTGELPEVKKHLRKKSKTKVIKLRNQINSYQILQVSVAEIHENQPAEKFCFFADKLNKNKYSPLAAFWVIVSSIFLYYFLYRSKFKIR